uniref:Dual specificity protein kinase Ttk n=2 Tax=Cacopsylla melanoneura TaxID=428564 RepID=A0A8D8TY96_9HEMI
MSYNVFSNYQRSQQENDANTDSPPSVFDLQFSNPIRRIGRRNRPKPSENAAPQFASNASEFQTHPVNPGAGSSFLNQLVRNSSQKNLNYDQRNSSQKNVNYDPSINTPDKLGSLLNQDILATRKKYPFLVSHDKENVVPTDTEFKKPEQRKNVFVPNKAINDKVDAITYALKTTNLNSGAERNNGLYPNRCFQTQDKQSEWKSPVLEDFNPDKPICEEVVPPSHKENHPSTLNKPLDLSPTEKNENPDSSQDSTCFETAIMSSSKLNFDSPLDLSSHSTQNISKDMSGTLIKAPPFSDMAQNNSELQPNPYPPSQEDVFLKPLPVANSLQSQSLPHLQPMEHHKVQQQQPISTHLQPSCQPQASQKKEEALLFKQPMSIPSNKQYTSSTPKDTVKQTPLSEPVIKPNVSARPAPILKKPQVENSQDLIMVNTTQYQVLGLLGKGGSSNVYIVREVGETEFKPLALKVVNLSTITDQSIADGYLNEVKLLAKLQGCPCVITMHDYEYETKSKYLYVLMEQGESDLHTYMKNINKMATMPNTIILIIKHWYEMLLAVKEIHSEGIIHSDLKPANFLFVGGVLKIIDFGIASSLQEDMTSVYKDTAAGTLNYMSPEAIKQHGNGSDNNTYRITYKSDVWSLGCILFTMIYGRTPYSHITNQWAKIQAICDNKFKIEFKTKLSNDVSVPPTLLQSMELCLQKDSKARPTVADLLEIIDSRINSF